MPTSMKSASGRSRPEADTPGAGRRDRRRQRARQELAEAAVELFERNGFAATTVEQIAHAADYSESTFFRHFPRKEDVIFYDLPERMEAMLAAFRAPGHDSAWMTVREAFVANAGTWETSGSEFALARIRLFHKEPALVARYLEYCLQWEDVVAEIVAADFKGDPDSELTSRLIAGATVSAFRAAFRAYLDSPADGLASQLSAAFDQLEAGLGGPMSPARRRR